MTRTAITETSIPSIPVRHGKVRDIYDLGEQILLVSTDRISAFDFILPSGIPDKGRVLTQLAAFWFDLLDEPHHLITTDVDQIAALEGTDIETFRGRSTLCKKTAVIPIECVVRGYLSGSGWKEYQAGGMVCGIRLPEGLKESDRLPEPIFTPATKAEQGDHDENIPFERMVEIVGIDVSEELRSRSIEIFSRGAAYALERGIIIADTKFEFGRTGGELILIDEVLTPDSSRFWPAELYEPGHGQPSFDKQFVRDWLLASDWDRESPPPKLPEETIMQTRAKYIEGFEKITGRSFE